MARGKWEKEWDEVRVRTGLMGKMAEFLRSKRAKELALTSNRAVVEYCLRGSSRKKATCDRDGPVFRWSRG